MGGVAGGTAQSSRNEGIEIDRRKCPGQNTLI